MHNYPNFIRVKFRSTEELVRYRGFGIDTDAKLTWAVSRETGLRLVLTYPDNFIAEVQYPDNSTLVSAVLCTCAGREVYGRRAVGEVLKQSWEKKELIIINQGGMWLTGEFEKFYEVRVPPWLNNGGMRNIGDAIAQGAYIVRLDDDDLYCKDRFKLQIEAIQQTGAPASSFQNIINYVQKEDAAWVRSLKCSPGLMMYQNEGRKYIEDIRKSSDTYFMAEHYNGQVATIDNPPEHYIRLYHGQNQLTNRKGLGEYDIERGARKNDTDLEVDWQYFEERIKEFK